MSLFKSYKPGQAKLSRMITLLSGWFLIVWGCRSLMRAVGDPAIWSKGALAWNEIFGGAADKDAWRIDAVVIEEKFSPAFTIAALLLVGLAFWWWRFLNREKWAELLIEMETELRKVSWPSFPDAWQSTLVVSGFTATVVVTILVYDLVIKGFLQLFVERA